MRTVYRAAAAVGFVVIVAVGSGASEESMDGNVLNRWQGTWKHHTIVKPAAWTLLRSEWPGASTGAWILGNQYQQISGHTGNTQTREIQRFDAESGQYHKWAFDSEGNSSFWIGAWDEKTETMTWKYVDFGLGIEGKIVNRFTGDDKYETTLVLEDSRGNVLLDIRSGHSRIAEGPE